MLQNESVIISFISIVCELFPINRNLRCVNSLISENKYTSYNRAQ
jgi:hypothetical protein